MFSTIGFSERILIASSPRHPSEARSSLLTTPMSGICVPYIRRRAKICESISRAWMIYSRRWPFSTFAHVVVVQSLCRGGRFNVKPLMSSYRLSPPQWFKLLPPQHSFRLLDCALFYSYLLLLIATCDCFVNSPVIFIANCWTFATAVWSKVNVAIHQRHPLDVSKSKPYQPIAPSTLSKVSVFFSLSRFFGLQNQLFLPTSSSQIHLSNTHGTQSQNPNQHPSLIHHEDAVNDEGGGSAYRIPSLRSLPSHPGQAG